MVGGSVDWVAGGCVLWVAGGWVDWVAGGWVLWVAGGWVDCVAGAWVLGSCVCGGFCGACVAPPPPPPPWQFGHGGGGSSGAELAKPGFSAEMPRPAATAAALTIRFIDMECVPSWV